MGDRQNPLDKIGNLLALIYLLIFEIYVLWSKGLWNKLTLWILDLFLNNIYNTYYCLRGKYLTLNKFNFTNGFWERLYLYDHVVLWFFCVLKEVVWLLVLKKEPLMSNEYYFLFGKLKSWKFRIG